MTATVSQSPKTTSGKLAHDRWVRSEVHSGSERLLEQQLSDLMFTQTSEHSAAVVYCSYTVVVCLQSVCFLLS